MATKKTAKKNSRTKKTSTGNGVKKKNGVAKRDRKPRKGQRLHPRKLRGVLKLELRSASLELDLKRQKLALVNTKLGALSMDPAHAEIFLLLTQKEETSKEMKESALLLVEVQKKISAKFDIPIERLHEYTFDTDTGAIVLDDVAPG